MREPKTLREAIEYFSDSENCRKFMVSVLWPDGVVKCPRCGSESVAYLDNAKLYFCKAKHPKQKFSLKVGTIFEDSPIGFEKWLPAFWLLVNCKNGVSSYELARALGVTQKTGWFMLHRIRQVMESQSFYKFGGPDGGPVEADETFIGGKIKNMHAKKKPKGPGFSGIAVGHSAKTIVMGMLDRERRQVRARVIPNVHRDVLQREILQNVSRGSTVYTDGFRGYETLAEEKFVHDTVNHVTEYVRGEVHTQGIENF